LHQSRLGAPLESLTGCRIDDIDQLPEAKPGHIRGLGQHTFHIWGELLTAEGETETLASYQDGFYAGKACATYRKLGRGSVLYVGAYTVDGTLERAAMQEAYKRAGQKVAGLPEHVFMDWHEGVWTCVNYSGKPYKVEGMPVNSKLIGGEDVPPGGVFVWK
jgi:beta-galactosidase